MTRYVPALLLTALAAACAPPAPPPEADMAAEPGGEWQVLFDGTSLDAWRGYQMEAMPPGWEIVDGALVRTGPGGDIVTRGQFGSFELELEWKVDSGGNSGIFYRVTEDAERTYHTGPEMQILDDDAHRDGLSPLTSAGANYGLHPAPPGAARPAGEWNAVRIRVDGDHVTTWLNGVETADYVLGSPDWERRVRESKFVEWPGYGRAARGHIALQDHGDRVAFRNIRVRVLP